jgi:membrane protease YdiL (CAAX protease family)
MAWRVCQKKADKILYVDGTIGELTLWNSKHLAGIILFLVGPLLLMKLPPVAFRTGIFNPLSIILVLVIGYLLFSLSIINGFNLPGLLKRKSISNGLYTGTIILRAIFLAAYEFFFRGAVLFSIVSYKSQYAAIILATVFYTVSHIGSTRKEIIATIPFGFSLCWITLETMSLLPAIILHWLVALPAEIIALNKIRQIQKSSHL